MSVHVIEMTDEALDVVTSPQLWALVHQAKRCPKLVVQKGGFDLPDGYLAIRIEYEPGRLIYGGVSVAGDIST